MTDHVFQCEGAPVPRRWSGITQRHLLGGQDDEAQRIDFSLELPEPLLGSLSARARDLVRIAAYVYLADGSVSRGGERDVYGHKWRRGMRLALAVDDPDFWRSAEVSQALVGTLSFLTEDDWEFDFSRWKSRPSSQLQLVETDATLVGNPGCVVLFSGGADSLAATVAAHREGVRPFLVSHRSSPLIAGSHRRLIDELRSRFSTVGFRQASAIVHRRGSDAPETSQRSRSFLFASLGTAVSGALGVEDVRLADNGFVSINLPLTDQGVGAQASRTTHPEYLRLFTEFACLVLERPLEVHNPLLLSTRAEALASLRDAGVQELLAETRSCAHPRARPSYAPHCGTCSQCVDRRFGVIAAELEDYDSGYETDIFTDELAEGEPRVIATSYLRLAQRLEQLQDEDFFLQYPQLYDCLVRDPNPGQLAQDIVAMLKRHAQAVMNAMGEQVQRHADDLIRPGRLPPTCLVRLVPMEAGSARPQATSRPGFRHSPDFSTVSLDGEDFSLGPKERAAFQLLHEALEQGTPELSGSYILEHEQVESKARSVSELFRRSGIFGKLVIEGSRKGVYRLSLRQVLDAPKKVAE
jgi:7-cyano-7-deazaguanine synthase in queuosine biosynthesis